MSKGSLTFPDANRTERRNATPYLALPAAQLVVFSLPFMQIMTINVGFPLKVYELTLALWTAVSILLSRVVVFDKRIFSLGCLFVSYVTGTLFVTLVVMENVGTYSDMARFSPFADGALKAGYVALCVLGFSLTAFAAKHATARIVSAWLWGRRDFEPDLFVFGFGVERGPTPPSAGDASFSDSRAVYGHRRT